MPGRSLIGLAGQRIGVALSQDLLAALSTGPAEIETTCPSPDAEPTLVDKVVTRRASALCASGNDSGASTSQSKPDATNGFRIFSLFGGIVPITSAIGSREFFWYSPMSTEDDNREGNATDPTSLIELIADPGRRRSWLLAKALETHPLDEALELARTAEAFIIGAPIAETGATAVARPRAQSADPEPERDRKPLTRRTPLTLAPAEREQLLQRLAQGARNAEVASEFGLSIRQIQGIRMGSAREIARRRDRVREGG